MSKPNDPIPDSSLFTVSFTSTHPEAKPNTEI